MKFTVNGADKDISIPAGMPLLWALRDTLGMTGVKFGCGMGLCGACTVHVDGKAVKSCSTGAASCEGKKVTTIEGLSANGDHPVQRAWIEKDVVQCGWCQPGQIMTASALLAATPEPTDLQIGEAMNGNLCRCGTYLRIGEAVKRASELIKGGK